MFFRVLKEGKTLVYEPKAMVRHRHRREYEKLKTQITNNGSLYSYFICGTMAYPDQLFPFLRLGIWWLFSWNLRRLLISFLHPTNFPRELIWAELKGGFISLTRYQQACRKSREIAQSFTEGTIPLEQIRPLFSETNQKAKGQSPGNLAIGVRTIEITQPIKALTDVNNYAQVRIFLTWKNQSLGSIDISNNFQIIGRSRLIEAIVNELNLKLLALDDNFNPDTVWAIALSSLNKQYRTTQSRKTSSGLSPEVSVSLVLATYDRPEDLRNCLDCLMKQNSPRKVEIIVVDNNPKSELTPPVVAEFPGVVLVQELRQGLAYARNAGIVASTGEIIVATDDDVSMSPDWLEKLVAPFARNDVMIVTGHVLPLELETESQQSFENYGGLGRGFEPFEVNGDWLELFPHKPSPTWGLGATANAAFRATIFSHPGIGLMEEALGPGMPSGVGEDTYVFYKVLKMGYTLVYEPKAYVWHKHRRDIAALKKQLYNYSKGHVSYNLTTWLQDHDWRGLLQVLLGLPMAHYYRIKERLLRRSEYPISLILLEIAGNLAGPWSLWQSHLRVKREGHS
ncbi:MAG: glycosyltransferase, partial [Crocosphaera sp.]